MPTYAVQRPTFRHNGDEYSEGDTVEMPEAQAQPLLATGALETEESGAQSDEGEVDGQSEADDEEPPRDTGGVALPDTFPAKDELYEAGFRTLEGVDEASDEQIESIDGIGSATREDIRDALDEARE